MTFPKARVFVSGALFVGWLGLLLYLVIDSRTVILSRPQFLLAELIIVADIGGKQANRPEKIVIDEVLWSNNPADVDDLIKKQVRIPGVAEWVRENGYEGPGKYLLPLTRNVDGSFQIAPLPRIAQAPAIRIYPWTERLRRQVDEIIRSRKLRNPD